MLATDDHSAYERVSYYVSYRTGLALPANRRPFIDSSIARAIAATHCATIDEYFDLLTKSDRMLDDLIAKLTVGETYFFRDPAHFEFIRREVLPEIRCRRGNEALLQLWSAGCASGEEAYSLAILLDEERISGSSRVLATDISRAALARAHEGVYDKWSLRNPLPGLIDRYFRRQGGRYLLADRIRRSVTFSHLNLAADEYLAPPAGVAGMDIILCRNVLIYIEPERISAVAQRLFAALSEGGWLITGPSDPLLSSHAPFDVALTPAGVFYRRAAPAPIAIGPCDAHERIWPGAAPTETASAAEIKPLLPDDPLSFGREAFTTSDYAMAMSHWPERRNDVEAAYLRVQSLANLGLAAEAERFAAAGVANDPLTAERHLLHAITLLSLQRFEDATAAAKRAIYLKSDFSVAHFILGTILHCVGAIEGARHAFRNSRMLASTQPGQAVISYSGGEPASRIAAAATAQLALLEEAGSTQPFSVGIHGRRSGSRWALIRQG